MLHNLRIKTLTETPEIMLGSPIVHVSRIQAVGLRAGSGSQRILVKTVRLPKAKGAAVPQFLVLCPSKGETSREGDSDCPNGEKEDSRESERDSRVGSGRPHP